MATELCCWVSQEIVFNTTQFTSYASLLDVHVTRLGHVLSKGVEFSLNHANKGIFKSIPEHFFGTSLLVLDYLLNFGFIFLWLFFHKLQRKFLIFDERSYSLSISLTWKYSVLVYILLKRCMRERRKLMESEIKTDSIYAFKQQYTPALLQYIACCTSRCLPCQWQRICAYGFHQDSATNTRCNTVLRGLQPIK